MDKRAKDKLRSALAELRRWTAELEAFETTRREPESALRESEERYRLIFNNCNDALFVYQIAEDGKAGNFVDVNDIACEKLGYKREELLQKSVYDVASPMALPGIPAVVQEILRNKRLVTESKHLTKDGRQLLVEVSCQLFTLEGKPTVLTIARDLTERAEAEEALRESQEHFRGLFEAVFDGIYIIDDDGVILDANPALAQMLGYERAELIGSSVMLMIPENDRDLRWSDVAKDKIGHPFETRAVRKDGSTVDVELFGEEHTYNGRTVRVTVVRDITERKRTERALRESEEHFRSLFETAFEGIVVAENGTILEVNPAFAKMFGYERAEYAGMKVLSLVAEQSQTVVTEKLRTSYQLPYEGVALRKDGSTIDVEVVGKEHTYRGRQVRVTVIRDITERKKSEEAIRHRATHDPLTEQPNRTLFFDRLNQALAQSKRGGSLLAVLYLDLNGFKEVNDSVGHVVGDRVLRSVAKRLQSCLRNTDTLARLGGDEFAVTQTNIADRAGAAVLAEKLVCSVDEAISTGEHRVRTGLSIGVALCPTDSEDADELLNCADMAMYRVKSQGRSGYAFYSKAAVNSTDKEDRKSA